MIYVVLVNWKRYDDTIECLESLVGISEPACRVIVVDNQTTTDGVQRIRDWSEGRLQADKSGPPWSRFASPQPAARPDMQTLSVSEDFRASGAPFLTVIANADNSGFAGGCNIGMKAALSDPDCGFIWLLNNDTVVDPMSLAYLEKMARTDPSIGICGSTLVYYDTPDVIQTLGGRFNRYMGRISNVGEGEPRSRLREVLAESPVDYMCAASILVSRAFIEKIGLLSEDYFLYFEELDWEARNRGRFKTAWAEEAVIYHKEGRSIGTNSRGRPSDMTLYYYNVNFLRFIHKFAPLCLPIALAKVVAVAAAFRLKGDAAGGRSVRLALGDFLTGKTRRGSISAALSTAQS